MHHIPMAVYLLGVLAALYGLVLRLQVKTKASRTRRPFPAEKR